MTAITINLPAEIVTLDLKLSANFSTTEYSEEFDQLSYFLTDFASTEDEEPSRNLVRSMIAAKKDRALGEARQFDNADDLIRALRA